MAPQFTIPLTGIVDALSVLVQAAPVDADALSVTSVTADSRHVQPGGLFVAVAGESHDGHAYLQEAVVAGAVAAIGTHTLAELNAAGIVLPDKFPYFVVSNARRALAEASAALYGFPSRDLVVIGVTGTDGKTSTCALLESILAAATRTEEQPSGRVGVITTVGARIRGEEQETGLHVTTPDAPEVQRFLAQMREAGCVYAVVESTSHGLAQERVAAVEYDVAAVTNITHEHLDYHGSREAYVQAKALLFRALFDGPGAPWQGRFAVLNVDDAGSYGALREAMAEEAARHGAVLPVRAYGIAGTGRCDDPACDVSAHDIVFSPSETRFRLRWWDGEFDCTTRLIGEFNVQNILCAATVALGLGVRPQHVQQGIAEMQGVLGRMERIDRGQPFLAVVDFAHSPASLERALETLRPLVGTGIADGPGRLISVFGCAGLRDRQKRRLMGRTSGRLADFTVITAEDPRTEELDAINAEIEAGVLEHAGADAYRIVPDRAEAIEFAVRMAGAGDVVAAFGKGHERSMCFGTAEYAWSDQQAMIDALEGLESEEKRTGSTP